MKKVLLFMCILFVGCQSKQERAEKLVQAYLVDKIKRSDYKPISFGQLHKIKDTSILINKKRYDYKYNGTYEIEYIYRDLNSHSYNHPDTTFFRIDKGFKKVECCFTGPYDPHGNFLITYR